MDYKLVLPCHFGMEACLKREIKDLGYETANVDDGKVTFFGDVTAIPKANIFLRTPERVMIELSSFTAKSFEALFDNVFNIPFEEYLPKDASFPVVKASHIDSTLASSRDIQSIVKKAIVERLKKKYHISWFEENGSDYPIRVFIKKDIVSIYLDTTGESLHKRGYKKRVAKAPISETLAAALLMLTPFRDDRILFDPFCGTGTFAIEAAMLSKNIAPGMARSFISCNWKNIIKKDIWDITYESAKSQVKQDITTNIYAYDINHTNIGHAKANASLAGVEGLIHFKDCDIRNSLKDFYKLREEYGFILTNPPYGERLSDVEIYPLYEELGKLRDSLRTWSMYVITSYPNAVSAIGQKPAKNRKVYNGMKKSYFYQYPGPKPPKAKPSEQN